MLNLSVREDLCPPAVEDEEDELSRVLFFVTERRLLVDDACSSPTDTDSDLWLNFSLKMFGTEV